MTGPSGSGKTTLLTVGGLRSPQFVLGQEVEPKQKIYSLSVAIRAIFSKPITYYPV